LVGFFVSGHPLSRFASEAKLFGTRTTADLGQWTEGQMVVAAVVTSVRRQTARRTGAEWAKLTIEDFHGAAECLVFPEAWKRLSRVIAPDGAYLITGGYSPRDRGEEDAPFIVESAEPLEQMKASGRMALSVRWSAREKLAPEAPEAVAALCRAHPGTAPVMVEFEGDNGGSSATFRSRSLRVALDDDLLGALERLLGAGHVRLVKAG
jgi:DNA polymerase-3 subunit alpha